MKERPILFSGPMVRAILDGRKTQTRRIVKPDPGPYWNPSVGMFNPTVIKNGGYEAPGPEIFGASDEMFGAKFPYGKPGDRLYVRETWCQAWDMERDQWYDPPRAHYRADGNDVVHVEGPHRSPWKPSIHMPRWASRILLEITDVRAERLQDISEDDAYAEGIKHSIDGGTNACEGFRNLWESINGLGSWDADPWVWVVKFRRIE